ncbi:phospholipase D-like domain-containing protein [Halorussus halobius]|uniref:phospholipase D-like domain-containing protein n=1 Tax=Halorussus halobius TaxID=1710537 RepID=UPI001FCEF623|nr:phospholipase D-like domain-containing protein [Halorussus halobius]
MRPFTLPAPAGRLALGLAVLLAVLAAGPPAVSVAAAPASTASTPATVAGVSPATVPGNASTVAPGKGASGDTPNASADHSSDAPTLVALYPNPATDGDAGEFVAVRFPNGTDASDWSLDDGESTVPLPNSTVSGRVAVSPDPEVARNRTDLRVLGLDADLSLANGGETVRLTSGDTVADVAEYDDAPTGERWHRTPADQDDWTWTPLGTTDFALERSGPASARAFVLPDSPEVPVETLRRADDRLLVAGYTFTSERAADALADAARRGVEVRLLVDDAPVGGLARREAELLDSLVARGVAVRVPDGPLARYRFHHAKYAVADDRALVLTENWKPAGTGGHGSRGWGAVVRDGATADRLAAVFRADAEWRAAVPWSEFRKGERFEPTNATDESYPEEIPPANVTVESAGLLVAPDHAESSLVSLLDAANESLRVQQVEIGDRRQPFVRASLRAARRGVDVRILLSSPWYAEEDNRALVEWLNERADSEDLPLDARLANPRGRYEKIHAKGVVVDGEAAVVGSMNWNNNSARNNREVGLVLRGEEPGAYYADAFDADWRASAGGPAGGERFPVGLLVAVAVGALAAILYARREVVFEN